MLDNHEIIAYNPKKLRKIALAALAAAKKVEAQQIANGAKWVTGESRSKILKKNL